MVNLKEIVSGAEFEKDLEEYLDKIAALAEQEDLSPISASGSN